jgi:hypothetical protein
MKVNLTEQQIREAIQNNITIADALRELGLFGRGGGYYRYIHRFVKMHSIDTSHWKGKAFLEGTKRQNVKRTPLSEILVEDSTYTGMVQLKKQLVENSLLEYKCYGENCGISEWHSQKLSLHIDHINGKHDDHRIENLRLLCPNCHSLTPTYSGKNRNPLFCVCGKRLFKSSKSCKRCQTRSIMGQKTKIQWPSDDKLIELVTHNPFTKVAKMLGVSDNGIRRYLKARGIIIKKGDAQP